MAAHSTALNEAGYDNKGSIMKNPPPQGASFGLSSCSIMH